MAKLKLRKDVKERLRIYWVIFFCALMYTLAFEAMQQESYNTQEVWNQSEVELAQRQYDLYLIQRNNK